MTNQFQDLIPKTMPPTITDPGPLAHTGAFWESTSGWIGFAAFSVVAVIVLIFLFILAMKVIYWITLAVTRGVHDGWTPTHTKIARGILLRK